MHLRKTHNQQKREDNGTLNDEEISVGLLELIEKERRAHQGKERIIALQFFLYTAIFCANWAPLTVSLKPVDNIESAFQTH